MRPLAAAATIEREPITGAVTGLAAAAGQQGKYHHRPVALAVVVVHVEPSMQKPLH